MTTLRKAAGYYTVDSTASGALIAAQACSIRRLALVVAGVPAPGGI
jgi:hypothetical protein